MEEEQRLAMENDPRTKRLRERFDADLKKFIQDFPDAQYLTNSSNGMVVVYSKQNKLIRFRHVVDFDPYTYGLFGEYPRTYKYSEIQDVDVRDDGHTINTTSTDTGNVVGRALVGAAVGGAAGAVIGGTTAKCNTTATEIHKYNVVVRTTRKIEYINFGYSELDANETALRIKNIISA